MRYEIAQLYERGKRRPQKEVKSETRLAADLQINTWPSSPMGRPSLVASIFKTTPTLPDPLPPLYDVRLEGMATLAFVIAGFELVDGVLYRQEWHCRECEHKYIAPWRACPHSSLDELI